MKKIFEPKSQLFLFSNTLDSRIEDWFEGSIIFENSILNKNNHCAELSKLECLIKTLNIGQFNYVTNVINFKPNNLLFVKISGTYPLICSFTCKSDYLLLNNLANAARSWSARNRIMKSFVNIEHDLLRHLKNGCLLDSEFYNNQTEAINHLMLSDKEIQDSLIQKFHSDLVI
ncbi:MULTISPECIES: hypothetical protein [unclassified Polynucleobacter]|jgi:hypothetical protein|uniref:hypothetical protein n=1 Tax=unclassified Polynucleobacter TaxID=2640945 RepID=UPI001BFDF9F8|nr:MULTISPECIES: hypothetical protein [unclassified Polynucleobacter]MBT8558517.1 hypothetical protein [Polynucleobacter paneuropaeus]QWD70374.1 hypothetical protein C2756_10860 [Polynucleobacter sp. UB-Siik-W21]QWD77965.1 hypothetical protein C2757_08830 [Polynucleobacter sp. MWH-Svant-W18]